MSSLITPVYGGRANVVFNEGRHFYTVSIPGVHDRLFQPGVTSILGIKDKPALINWAVKQMRLRILELATQMGGEAPISQSTLKVLVNAAEDSWRDVKEEAADIGKLAHRALELHLKGTPVQLPLTGDALLAPNLTPDMLAKATRAVEAGLRYFDKHKVEVIATEAPRWSPTYGYIGTGDLIARIDGLRSCLDFKSGKGIHAEYRMQTAAYSHAWEEEFPDEPIEQRVVARVGALDGELEEGKWGRDTFKMDFLAFRNAYELWKWDRVNGYRPKEAIEIIGDLDKLIPRV